MELILSFMLKFKLLQEYPNSPKTGTIISTPDDSLKQWPQYWVQVCLKCETNIKVCKTFGCKKK